jgi:hypothetical protein
VKPMSYQTFQRASFVRDPDRRSNDADGREAAESAPAVGRRALERDQPGEDRDGERQREARERCGADRQRDDPAAPAARQFGERCKGAGDRRDVSEEPDVAAQPRAPPQLRAGEEKRAQPRRGRRRRAGAFARQPAQSDGDRTQEDGQNGLIGAAEQRDPRAAPPGAALRSRSTGRDTAAHRSTRPAMRSGSARVRRPARAGRNCSRLRGARPSRR